MCVLYNVAPKLIHRSLIENGGIGGKHQSTISVERVERNILVFESVGVFGVTVNLTPLDEEGGN